VPDFLVCGHAVQDLPTVPREAPWRLGGAVSYASLLAQHLGLKAAVLTSASRDVDFEALLPDIEVIKVASERSTQMRNVYQGGRRRQEMPQRASRIGAQHLPQDWRRAPIVLLGPVAGELDDSLADCFSDSLMGAGAQGWLRETGAGSRVRPVPPERWIDEPVLRRARALFVSDEDVAADKADAALQRWCGIVETVAFTRGYDGADVCHKLEWRHIDAFPVKAVDPTGAGDIFAAAFLFRLHETGDAWEATRFASCAASFVVEGEGIAAIPDRKMVESRLQEHPEIVAR
jgi:sugar/nucleoside kinase (ribokinase family)